MMVCTVLYYYIQLYTQFPTYIGIGQFQLQLFVGVLYTRYYIIYRLQCAIYICSPYLVYTVQYNTRTKIQMFSSYYLKKKCVAYMCSI